MTDPSDRPLHPTLREYLEQRLDYERSLVMQKFDSLQTALQLQREITELQAAEFTRRLLRFERFEGDTSRALTAITTRSVTWASAIGIFFAILSLLFAVAIKRGGP